MQPEDLEKARAAAKAWAAMIKSRPVFVGPQLLKARQ
jgi:hypothetical protein